MFSQDNSCDDDLLGFKKGRASALSSECLALMRIPSFLQRRLALTFDSRLMLLEPSRLRLQHFGVHSYSLAFVAKGEKYQAKMRKIAELV